MGRATGQATRAAIGRAEAALGAARVGAGHSFAARVAGAVRLDPAAWDEIARDRGALTQAALVVLLATGATVLAAAYVAGPAAAIESALGVLASWLLVAGLLGGAARILGHRLPLGTALRVVGFAMAPLVLIALAALRIDHVEAVVRMLALALFIAGLVAGTRQALGVETTRAALVCAGAGLCLLLITMIAVALSVA